MDEKIGDLGKWLVNYTEDLLRSTGLSSEYFLNVRTLILFTGMILLCMTLWWLSRKIFTGVIYKIAEKSKTKWDDYLVENKFFRVISNLVPLLCIDAFVRTVFVDYQKTGEFVTKSADVLIVLVILLSLLRFLSAFEQVLSEKEKLKDKPIQSYFQLVKIILSGFMIILGLSIATGMSPVYYLTSLGAMTAIILLIFKDTILIAKIKISTHQTNIVLVFRSIISRDNRILRTFFI